MIPNTCEACEESSPTLIVRITNLAGVLLDRQYVCADCCPEGYQVGECQQNKSGIPDPTEQCPSVRTRITNPDPEE